MKSNSLNFVLSPSYHGATLLSILLNSHPEIAALGDTVPKWIQECACKKKVINCEFWTPILAATKEHHSSGDWVLDHIPAFTASNAMNRSFSLFLSGAGIIAGNWMTRLGGKTLTNYKAGHELFRQTILEQMNASVFIDGQKSLAKALLHRALSPRNKTVRIIHLVRDPRGFLASSKRSLNHHGLEAAAEQWTKGHQRIALLKKPLFRMEYNRVRYEDICATPDETMNSLFAFLGLNGHNLTNLKEEKTYHLIGNKMLHHFDGKIRLSTKWKEELTPDESIRMLELTRPLSQKYGYE